jgi:hypothetical protein
MVAISCFYISYNNSPVKLIFIQFKQFMKIMLNNRIIILTYKQLIYNIKLFQLFKLSILCTEDTSRIYINSYAEFGVSTRQYLKRLEFTDEFKFVEFSNFKYQYKFVSLDKLSYRDPFLAQEPKRSSSSKKIRKFEKLFDSYIFKRIKQPNDLLNEYFDLELLELNNYFTKYINNEAKIQLLSSILHNYGRDVYSSVRKFL